MKELFVENRTKILGGLQTMLFTILSMQAMGAFAVGGQFAGMIPESLIKWLSLIGVMLGTSTAGIGFINTTKERVAGAMETAIKATPTDPAGRTEGSLGARVSSWLPFVLAVGVAMTLSGCAGFGVEEPQGFRDRAVFAEQTVNGVIAATTSSLNAGAIKSVDAEYVRKSANEARSFLLAAESAYDAGDVSTAEARLSLATTVLLKLQSYVKPKRAP